jgi:hypothetical protein
MEHVSMSWWMPQPVQAYLDAQLCLPANWKRLECELREGRTTPGRQVYVRIILETVAAVAMFLVGYFHIFGKRNNGYDFKGIDSRPQTYKAGGLPGR